MLGFKPKTWFALLKLVWINYSFSLGIGTDWHFFLSLMSIFFPLKRFFPISFSLINLMTLRETVALIGNVLVQIFAAIDKISSLRLKFSEAFCRSLLCIMPMYLTEILTFSDEGPNMSLRVKIYSGKMSLEIIECDCQKAGAEICSMLFPTAVHWTICILVHRKALQFWTSQQLKQQARLYCHPSGRLVINQFTPMEPV